MKTTVHNSVRLTPDAVREVLARHILVAGASTEWPAGATVCSIWANQSRLSPNSQSATALR